MAPGQYICRRCSVKSATGSGSASGRPEIGRPLANPRARKSNINLNATLTCCCCYCRRHMLRLLSGDASGDRSPLRADRASKIEWLLALFSCRPLFLTTPDRQQRARD